MSTTDDTFKRLEAISRRMGAPISEAPDLIAAILDVTELRAEREIERLVSEGKVARTDDGRLIFPSLQGRHLWKRRPVLLPSARRRVIARDGYFCAYCGTEKGPLELDHVYPWSRGGEHNLNNLVLSCQPCNLTKGDKTLSELLHG